MKEEYPAVFLQRQDPPRGDPRDGQGKVSEMNKTFVTKMPNHIGAFLKASRCFAALGINITRVSYNKAVDSHMLFIDAEGTPQQLAKAAEELTAIGYLQCDEENRHVVLLEFRLKDKPGSVAAVPESVSSL